MICIEIIAPGGPEVLKAAERPDPVPGPGERADSCGGGWRQSARRAAAARRISAAAGRQRHSRASKCAGTIAARRRRRGRLARGRSRLRAGVRRRLRDDVRGARAAVSAGASLARSRGGRGDPRNVLHGLDERVRSRPPAGGRDRALSRRHRAASARPRFSSHARAARSVFATAGSDEKCRACEALGADARSTTARRTSSRSIKRADRRAAASI